MSKDCNCKSRKESNNELKKGSCRCGDACSCKTNLKK